MPKIKKDKLMDIQLLASNAYLPTKGSADAAGYDIHTTEDYILAPKDRHAFETGVSLAIPKGYYGRIAPRSGLAAKKGIDVLAGVIDSDYRGEIKVILVNLGDQFVTFKAGDRIAQIIFENHTSFIFNAVTNLTTTERGTAGIGSTGIAAKQ